MGDAWKNRSVTVLCYPGMAAHQAAQSKQFMHAN